jgi:homoserine O-acetyltransferase
MRCLLAILCALVLFSPGEAFSDGANRRPKIGFHVGKLGQLGKRALSRVIAFSEPSSRHSSNDGPGPLKQTVRIKNFRLGGSYEQTTADAPKLRPAAEIKNGGVGGVTLESLGVEQGLELSYIAVGKKQLDANGKIKNAVVVSTHYSGDSRDLYDKWYGSAIGPGKLIDTNKYYVVFLDAVGLWGTSKPSAGLGKRFPKYNAWDYTQANYRLLTDGLGIGKVRLAMGASLGAFQSYMLASLHPNFVDAIMPMGGSTSLREAADVRGLFQTMTTTMELARKSNWLLRLTGGKHVRLFGKELKGLNRRITEANEDVLARGLGVLLPTAFDGSAWQSKSWADGRGLVYSTNRNGPEGAALREKAAGHNPIDFLYRNAAGATFHVRPHLSRIKADTLILHVENDKWLNVEYAKEARGAIAGAKLHTIRHPLSHYGLFELLKKDQLGSQVAAWMKQIGMEPGAIE